MTTGAYSLPDNLVALDREERDLRTNHLAVIDQSPLLQRHVSLIHDTLDVVVACIRRFVTTEPDLIAIQMLGLRTNSSIQAAFNLIMNGYYQPAGHSIRDLLETSFLLDYFHTFPSDISVWRLANAKTLAKKFKPVRIREALNKRDGVVQGRRDKTYQTLCTYTAHPTHAGFSLIVDANRLGRFSPYFDDKLFVAMIEELTNWAPQAAGLFINHFHSSETFTTYADRFDSAVRNWRAANEIDYPD